MGKQHKYNVGDTFMVQIAAVAESNGKPVYRIKGIENIKFSEGGIDAMNAERVKPGDTVYVVGLDHSGTIVYFEAWEVEDIATKEIKIMGNWLEKDNNFVYDLQEAERKAEEYSKEYNYPVVRGGTTRRGGTQWQNSITTIHVLVHRVKLCSQQE